VQTVQEEFLNESGQAIEFDMNLLQTGFRQSRGTAEIARSRSPDFEDWASEGNRRLHAIRREQGRAHSDFDSALCCKPGA